MRKAIYLILSVVLLVLSGQVSAASFNCKNAHSDVEIMVCMDYRLSGLDDQLAYVYAKANASDDLKTTQRDWVKQRNQCKDFKCLVDAYANRIKAIDPQATPVFSYPPSDTGKWDYVAEKGKQFSSSVLLNNKGNLLVQYGWNSDQGLNLNTGDIEKAPKKFTLIYLDANPYLLKKLTESSLNKLSYADHIEGLGDYLSCGNTLDTVGVSFERFNEPWRKESPHRVLVIEAMTEPIQGCDMGDVESINANVTFWFFPHRHNNDFIWKDNFYLIETDDRWTSSYLLRFDNEMNTYGEVIGRQVFVPESEDLIALAANQCGDVTMPKDPYRTVECINRRLFKLTAIVRKFHQRQ